MRKIWSIVLFGIFLGGCITESPEFRDITLSQDSSKVIFQFTRFTITKQSAYGTAGYNTSYLDVYDVNTGKKLTEDPFEPDGVIDLKGASKSTILTSSYDRETKSHVYSLYDLSSGDLIIGGEDLKAKNKGLEFKSNLEKVSSPHQKSGYLLDGDDGRRYFMDDQGNATPLNNKLLKQNPGNFELPNSFRSDSLEIKFSYGNRVNLMVERRIKKDTLVKLETLEFPKGIYFGNNMPKGKKKVKHYARQLIITKLDSSSIDFLDPRIVCYDELYASEDKPIFWKNNLFVLSKTKDSFEHFEWQFTCFPFGSVKEKWSTILTNPLSNVQGEEIKLVYLLGQYLIILTNQSINSLDLESGKWKYNVRIIDEFPDGMIIG